MNVLIVDDDRFVIDSLKTGISWKELGFSNIFTASNINEAYEIIRAENVSLLLSDIDMPYGSGLELLSRIRDEKNDMPVIFLTNYADFEYAQIAVSLKSFHYFLKPIEYDKLTEIIKKATLQISQKNTQKDKICEHFWHSFLTEKIACSEDVLAKHFTDANLPYGPTDIFVPVIFDLFPYYMTSKDDLKCYFQTPGAQTEYIRVAFESIFFQSPTSDYVFLEHNITTSRYLAIIRLESDVIPPQLVARCEQMVKSVLAQSGAILCCSVGTPCTFHTFHKVFRSLRDMAANNVRGKTRVNMLSSYRPNEKEYTPIDGGLLELYLTNEQYGAFLEYCMQYLNQLASCSGLNANSLNSFQVDVVQVIYAFLKSKGILAHKLLYDNTYHTLSNHARRSIQNMEMYLRYIMRISKDHLSFSASETSVADSIREYIDSHYAEDITRDTLSDILFLNPDYASKLFKKEMGVSVGNYLIQKRISVAQNLLDTTDLSVNAISDNVGYGNYSYFIRLFKKMTNMTPIEYRNRAKFS